MAKNLKKLLAIALTIAMIAALCVVPMTASAAAPADETYDSFDVVTYNDLRSGGNSLDGRGVYINGGNTFTYNATSSSYSAKLKFTWLVGSDTGVQISFDKAGDSMSYLFGLWIKKPDDGAPNGAWWMVGGQQANMSKPVKPGELYDIEMGRLKVLTGANTGKYYVYLKVDGELLSEAYTSVITSDYSYADQQSTISNQILFADWNSYGNVIKPTVEETETYDDYDDIAFYNLKNGTASMAGQTLTSGATLSYDATSPSYSVKFKYRWIPGESNLKMTTYFDSKGQYPFCFGVKTPNQSDWGDTAGPNGSWHLDPSKGVLQANMGTPIVAGQTYDVEIGRLLVTGGANQGKYFVYWKVNDKMVQYYYYNGVSNGAYDNGAVELSSNIVFSGVSGGRIMSTPVDEAYDDYDEITFNDLSTAGQSMDGRTMTGNHTYTYSATSSSYSLKFKYRWIPGGDSMKFTTYLDGASKFPFCFAVKTPYQTNFGDVPGPNGAWHLVPSNGSLMVNMDTPIVSGQPYDIELGRLKVKTGDNFGKYYVYWKVNGEMIQSYYYDGVVDGVYESVPLASSITINLDSGNSIMATPIPDVFDEYDEVVYSNLRMNGNRLLDSSYKISGGKTFTYDATSSSYSAKFNFRWTIGDLQTMQFSFDKNNTSGGMSYPFGVWVKAPNADGAGANGAWHLYPSGGASYLANMTAPLAKGDVVDVELGRLKVVGGEKSHIGKYYVYLKIDGELVKDAYIDLASQSTYTQGDSALSNVILMANWGGSAGFISDSPFDEEYDSFDEVTFDDLSTGGQSMAGRTMTGNHTYTYDATSPSNSVKFKYRWIAGGDVKKSNLMFDGEYKYPFWFATKCPNDTDVGGGAGANGAWHLKPGSSMIKQMDRAAQTGDTYDMEVGRLKVITGPHTGDYYVYWKVNGQQILSYYYDGVVDGAYEGLALNNSILITLYDGNSVTATPVPETYAEYDDITFDDLYKNGVSMAGQTGGAGTYTYNGTSPTYSVNLSFRYIAGGTEKKIITYLDGETWALPFCYALKTPNQSGWGAEAGANGAWHLNPGRNDLIVQLDEAVQTGDIHDMELGRLKVLTGSNKGKYYVYWKIDGELIASYYYDGVNASGNYGGNALAYAVNFQLPSGNTVTAIPIPETYEEYDEIGYDDFTDSTGTRLAVGGQSISGGNLIKYNQTSPTGSVIAKYRWKVGENAQTQVSFESTLNKDSNPSMEYKFGFWLSDPSSTDSEGYSNGRMWLSPGNRETFFNMPTALTPGSSYNIEYARLKVKTGSNKGKYLIYVKFDDVLVASAYIPGSEVAADLTYTDQDQTCDMHSGELFISVHGSSGSAISPYKEIVTEHEGIRGDFDNNETFNAADIVGMVSYLIGAVDTTALPSGIADYNNDHVSNIVDLVVMKQDLTKGNDFNRTGNIKIGAQEHLYEDETKTPEYIADATAALGATTYRLSRSINSLFWSTSTNGVVIDTENMAELKAQVAALTAKGITNILYVTDAWLLPYGYSDPAHNHNKTVPDPTTDPTNYEAWLTVNANAFKALAQEIPEIKYFEPDNETNLIDSRFEKYGIGWNVSAEEQKNYKYSTAEKARIMADLCWYISDAVKSVDRRNQVTTPSISAQDSSAVDSTFLTKLYSAIESGAFPSFKATADKRIDNYFTIVNLHIYPVYHTGDSTQNTDANNLATQLVNAYNVVKSYNDGDSHVWLTETGMSPYGSRTEANCATILQKTLNKLNTTDLDFIESAFLYKIADIATGDDPEAKYGLFYGPNHTNAYEPKQTAKVVYSFTHNGSTDYTALNNVANKYK